MPVLHVSIIAINISATCNSQHLPVIPSEKKKKVLFARVAGFDINTNVCGSHDALVLTNVRAKLMLILPKQGFINK